MSQQIIDAFIDKNGTVEDWGGDREGWRQALGSFTMGWLACKEAVEHSVQRTPEQLDRLHENLDEIIEVGAGGE